MSHPLPKSSAGAIEKDQILEKLTLMCARDLRPFNIVQGVGFREFAECCVAIGATHGRVDIDSLLPDRTSISRRVGEIAEDLKARFLPDVRNALKTRSCAFDADMWTDKYVQNNYLCVTSQFINESGKCNLMC